MNKEYIYIDGKVIVEDHSGQKRVTEYKENLDEILIEENLIEVMENEIKNLEEESKTFSKENMGSKLYILSPFLTSSLLPTICFKVLFPHIFNNSIELYNTAFGTMTESTFFTTLFTMILTPLGTALSLSFYDNYKKEQQRKKGVEIALDSLKKRLEEAKQDIIEMKNKKRTISEDKGFRVEKVNDEKQIKNLQGHINLYFDLGRNEEKYYKYYQKYGELPKKVQEMYTKLGQEIIEDHLEEKSNSLAKTRIRKK